MAEQIDDVDRNILNILQNDGRLSNVELSRKIGLAPSAALNRVRGLVARGVIRGFTALVDRLQLSLGVCAFISIRTDEPLRAQTVVRRLTALPEVLEIHDVAGTDCYLLKVVTRDLDELHALIHRRIAKIEHVRSTSTSIVLRTFKDTTRLPLSSEAAA